MKKQAALLLAFAFTLFAADFWNSKPYTDWSAKDVQKVMTDSPWAKRVSVPLGRGGRGAPAADPEVPSGGRGRRGGGGNFGDASTSGSGGGRGGAGSQGLRGGAGNIPDDNPVLTPAVQLIVRLQTALPVKQALVKARFGAKAGTAPEGKQFIERAEQFYVVSVSGLPDNVLPRDDEGKKAVLQTAKFRVKNEDEHSVAASDVQFQTQNRNTEALFFFPRKEFFTAKDKEIEFV
ncbi:MAG TPA: hypothetical protein VFW83_09225, partial [Bryobacteraceae bacterium]|nr:hypothetical protein [Bryobacteraceae bacterium]